MAEIALRSADNRDLEVHAILNPAAITLRALDDVGFPVRAAP